jgi:hypothetical protein
MADEYRLTRARVVEEELADIARRSGDANAGDRLVGLAFSGGAIRSRCSTR